MSHTPSLPLLPGEWVQAPVVCSWLNVNIRTINCSQALFSQQVWDHQIRSSHTSYIRWTPALKNNSLKAEHAFYTTDNICQSASSYVSFCLENMFCCSFVRTMTYFYCNHYFGYYSTCGVRMLCRTGPTTGGVIRSVHSPFVNESLFEHAARGITAYVCRAHHTGNG